MLKWGNRKCWLYYPRNIKLYPSLVMGVLLHRALLMANIIFYIVLYLLFTNSYAFVVGYIMRGAAPCLRVLEMWVSSVIFI